MEKSDVIGLSIAYVGILFQAWWGIWSYAAYGVPFSEINTFVITFGGLI